MKELDLELAGSELEQAKAEHARELAALKDQHEKEMDALRAELSRVPEAVPPKSDSKD